MLNGHASQAKGETMLPGIKTVGIVGAGQMGQGIAHVCAAAGYNVLSRGFRSPRLLVEAYRRPEVPYPAGPQAARLGATAMIDVSDGLLADLGHVATASGIAMDLRRDAFDLPAPMRDAANALGVDPYQWILAGGEDHREWPPVTITSHMELGAQPAAAASQCLVGLGSRP